MVVAAASQAAELSAGVSRIPVATIQTGLVGQGPAGPGVAWRAVGLQYVTVLAGQVQTVLVGQARMAAEGASPTRTRHCTRHLARQVLSAPPRVGEVGGQNSWRLIMSGTMPVGACLAASAGEAGSRHG